ncbi:hypothetical protein F511_12764 [Dorcoceras hygrometricum]|uniref:Uncharacterized protein n=1 Tax=Dorcoceras hygrometricum TaxID=472368 RepID=A0A2Z7D837_9LAMI|nr:hypothetical protein F511_12764 [Dorcoceras hygrometricum]
MQINDAIPRCKFESNFSDRLMQNKCEIQLVEWMPNQGVDYLPGVFRICVENNME